MSNVTAYDNKYRPKHLSEIIGNARVAKRLQKIIETGQWPSAIMFLGEPSSGKTTLARALACDVLGVETVERNSHPCFYESNSASERSIDAVRDIVSISRQRPNMGSRRIIFLDEVQGLLTNRDAAQALLTALESPPPSTTWLLGSMEPEKFKQTIHGRALLSRCTIYKLDAPTKEDLYNYGLRILKGENALGAFTKDILIKCAESCGEQYRQMAHILQDLVLAARSLPAGQKLTLDEVNVSLAGGSDPDFDSSVLAYFRALYGNQADAARAAVARQHKEGYRFLSSAIMFHSNAMIAAAGGGAPIFGIGRDIGVLLKGKGATASKIHHHLIRLRTDPTVTGFETQFLMTLPEQLGI